jgi:sugar lactone lactonase YvrE
VYVIDGHRVRRVRPNGLIETVAGQASQAGFTGDGAAATSARLNGPKGVAIAADGTVYIADTGNHRIRKVTPTGLISTVAGAGTCGSAGDGLDATLAQLCSPDDVALLAGGVVAIADTGNHRVRRVDATNVISTMAGTGTMGTTGDGGPATAAQLLAPTALAFDGTDSLFLVTGARVRRVRLSTGNIDTYAGNGTLTTTVTDGVPATSVGFGLLTAIDWSAGGLLLADSAAQRVRLVRATTGLLETVAGAGLGATGVGGVATRALVETPVGLGFAADGTVYVTTGHAVMKVTPSGLWEVVAGRRDEAGATGDGGPALAARFSSPDGLAVGPDGSLYVADTGNHRIRRISPSGVVSTVAGTGVAGFSGDEGPGLSAQLSSPRGVAVDGEGLLYIADTGNHRIRRLESDGRISTLAGTGVAGFAGDGSGARAMVMNGPADVAVSPSGDVFIADSGNGRVRRIAVTGRVSTTLGGGRTCPTPPGSPPTQACLTLPTGVFATAAGVYVTDAQAGRVWLVDDAGLLSLVAGSGGATFSGDSTSATQASLRQPRRAGVMASGVVLIADTGNSRLRSVVTARGVRNATEVAVPSSDGSLVHIFKDSTKQHLRTVLARTGVVGCLARRVSRKGW